MRITLNIMEVMSEQLIDVQEVCRRVNLSRTSIWIMERRGTFPRGIRLGRAARWRSADVDQWIRDKTAAAETPARAGEDSRSGAPAPSGDVPPAGA